MGRQVKNIKELVSQLINQMAGDADESIPLLPEYCIVGSDFLYCLEYSTRSYIKISRGQKAFVLDEEVDHLNRVLIYTNCGRIVEIDVDELFYTEFD